ncbi:hypothetical protein O7635_01860 [Asanoa sp. WMMD1127]|uniref:serine hydrolase n=1 Tax=Asanoa sp. WMMD1127 TaxID=3016107 RepID=UPI002417E956|nr:serine hydrolase [Asanoa sp. WMMD1127]MDG4820596.1 hypothetical protein [Asanoa sp. WMMD1127]
MKTPQSRTSRRGLLAAAVLALAGGGAAEATVVWRRSSTGGAAPTPAAATLSPTPSPTPDYLAAAKAKVAAYVAESGNGHVALAVRDRTTGLALTIGGTRFPTASIIKVDILAALLLRSRQGDLDITDSDRRNAKKSITLSDNDATTKLFWRIGGKSGLSAANKTFGLKETRPNGAWGSSSTTVADQIRLLTALTDENGPLDDAGRRYLFGLMSQVDEEQDWGVPAAATTATTGVFVKNGWDTIGADGGLWQVNTIGRLVEPGHDWLVAVLSGHHRTHPAGVRMVEAMAKYALKELRKIPIG